MTEFWLGVLCALAIVIPLGHFLWVGLAWLFRLMLGLPRSTQPGAAGCCVFCGAFHPGDADICARCGRTLRGQLFEELTDLEAMRRGVERLSAGGVLRPDVAANLLHHIEDYRAQRLGTPPKPVFAQVSPQPPATAAEPVVPVPSQLVAQEGSPAAAPPSPAEAIPSVVPPAIPEWEPPSKPAAPERVVPPTPVSVSPAAPVSSAAPVSRPAVPVEPVPVAAQVPAPPRRSMAEMLAGFMEPHNIRWGEIVSGMMIVSGMVFLVISLRETLAHFRYFRAGLLLGLTSGIFGLGLYAFHRWKLLLTGRGLMTVGMLLVPLNFLAMAIVGAADSSPATLGIEAGVFGVLAACVYYAGRASVPGGAVWQTVAVLGSSSVMPWLARFITADATPPLLLMLGLLPTLIYLAGACGHLFRLARRSEPLDGNDSGGVFTLCGTAGFALATTLGLTVFRAVQTPAGWPLADVLCIPLALASLPVLAGGLLVTRRMTFTDETEPYRTAGIAVALTGGLVLLAALGLAWPWARLMLAIALLNTLVLALAAWQFRSWAAHAGAMAMGVLAYLLAFLLVTEEGLHGESPGLAVLRGLVSAESGTALLGVFALFTAVGVFCGRTGRKAWANLYGTGALAVSGFSLLMVTSGALLGAAEHRVQPMVVYGCYGAGCLVLNLVQRRPAVVLAGIGLLIGASCWGYWCYEVAWGPRWPMLFAMESLVFAVAARLLAGPGGPLRNVALWAPADDVPASCRLPLAGLAEVCAAVALAMAVILAFTHAAELRQSVPFVVATVCLAGAWFVLAWEHRSPERTWLASVVAALGWCHALQHNYAGLVEAPLPTALLAHATLSLLAALGVQWFAARGHGAEEPSDSLDARGLRDRMQVWGRPLRDGAVAASVLVIPAILLPPGFGHAAAALGLLWLAGLWLVLGWQQRSSAWLAAHQAALALAGIAGCTAWLAAQSWAPATAGLWTPLRLQAYGVVLGGLSLAWMAIRVAVRRWPAVRSVLEPGWPMTDRLVLYATVAGHLLVLVPPTVALSLQEMGVSGAAVGWSLDTWSIGAWGVTGLLAAALVLKLGERWHAEDLVAGTLLAAGIPCLVAGIGANDLAVASAWRWAAAAMFVVLSSAVWARRPLVALAGQVAGQRAGGDIGSGVPSSRLARTMIVAGTAVPVVVLTVVAALTQWFGSLAGPLPASWFGRMGMELSYLIPLLVVVGGLVGHALRERWSGYAFAAGCVVELAVALGYPLILKNLGLRFDGEEIVAWVHWVSLSAALWALAWLVARRWVDVWRERSSEAGEETPSVAREHRVSTVLMNLQLSKAIVGNSLILGPALLALALAGRHADDFSCLAGSVVGWSALAALVVAWGYRRIALKRVLNPHVVGFVGLTALGLLACTIQIFDPVWGHRALMLGWSLYALLIVGGTWWIAEQWRETGASGPPPALVRMASVWVRVAGLLAVLVGLQASVFHDEALWGSGAIALASAAGATMALWRRREQWAFAAALGVNLAASLLVWHFCRTWHLLDWWTPLLQGNVIATAGVALAWLALRRRIYPDSELTWPTGPLLTVQTTLAGLGTAAMLLPAALILLAEPSASPQWIARVATKPGLLAVCLTAAASGWFLWEVARQRMYALTCGLLAAMAILGACHIGAMGGATSWPAYHALMASLAGASLVALAMGWLCRQPEAPAAMQAVSRWRAIVHSLGVSNRAIQAGTTALGAAALLTVVLGASADPSGWAWPFGTTLAVGMAAAIIVIVWRQAAYVYLAAGTANVAATVLWLHLAPRTPAAWGEYNALALGVSALAWSLLALAVPRRVVPLGRGDGRMLALAEAAVSLALAILGALVAIALVGDLTQDPDVANFRPAGPLAGGTLAACAAAIVAGLWDIRRRAGLGGLYAAGLVGVGLQLVLRPLAPWDLIWLGGIELAAFVFLAAGLSASAAPLRRLASWCGIPDSPRRWSAGWFDPVQIPLMAALTALSVWLTIDVRFDALAHPIVALVGGRPGGALCGGLVLAGSLLRSRSAPAETKPTWQVGSLVLGLMVLGEIGWAMLPGDAATWLHRSVIGMTAAVAMAMVAGLAIPALASPRSTWPMAGRLVLPWFAGLAGALLVVVLVMETLPGTGTVGWPAVLAVGVALVGLGTTGIVLAVRDAPDPFGLSPRGRTAYVYAAEAIAALVGLHLWLTRPEWFALGIVERYWVLLVMAGAFGGAMLAEWFQRRKLPVLAEPLGRTALVLPALPAAASYWLIDARTASMWFAIGLFYGLLAVIRRSPALGILSAVSANMGLWVTWHRLDIEFLDSPQLFLIPGAIAVLVAEHFTRDRLGTARATSVRYAALSVVYISSTADLFLAGLGESIVLPLVLVGLSLAGIFGGMLLRVQSFLYLGLTFLVVVTVSMGKYVVIDLDYKWVLWASVVVLGVLIMGMFALFEKRRNEVLATLERIRRWEK